MRKSSCAAPRCAHSARSPICRRWQTLASLAASLAANYGEAQRKQAPETNPRNSASTKRNNTQPVEALPSDDLLYGGEVGGCLQEREILKGREEREEPLLFLSESGKRTERDGDGGALSKREIERE